MEGEEGGVVKVSSIVLCQVGIIDSLAINRAVPLTDRCFTAQS